MNIKTLGIDIAKRVFELHGVDEKDKVVLKQRVSRGELVVTIAHLPPCLIGIEACSGAHYWARRFRALGHEVKLINPQFVKPYVKSNKNDSHDAQAICEAVGRPSMRFVAVKNVGQQDIQALHRIRERLVKDRTALVNQIRGLLTEYGIVIAQGIDKVRKQLPIIIENVDNELSVLGQELLHDLQIQLLELDSKVKAYDRKVDAICRANEMCQRLTEIEGVGALTATAVVASVGDAKVFKNGRELAAFIGLVPKQHSSGGKQKLLGISKRGDRYLRCLLIHGARAVLIRAKNLPDKKEQWLKDLVARRGHNKAIVALANKNARVMWAMMAKQEAYQRDMN